MGFNTEAYATMLSRLSINLSAEELRRSKENRAGALSGLRKYIRETNERLNEGANVWIGETPVTMQPEKE